MDAIWSGMLDGHLLATCWPLLPNLKGGAVLTFDCCFLCTSPIKLHTNINFFLSTQLSTKIFNNE